MNSENAIFGMRIRSVREYQKLSREKLAELANISTQFLADIENGKKGMTVVTLRKICCALHISSDSIIFGNESENMPQIESMLASVPAEKKDDFQQIVSMMIKLI